MLRAVGAGRCNGWARREVREEEVFTLRDDLRELAFVWVLFAADEAFFFATGAGVSLVPLDAERVPTGGSRQRRQSSEKTKRRDINKNLTR